MKELPHYNYYETICHICFPINCYVSPPPVHSAPPQITNILNYPGQCYPPVKRNQCMASKVTYNGISFDVSVTFDGVGPFYVRWFFNGSEIHCSDKAKKDNCEHNVTRSSEKV